MSVIGSDPKRPPPSPAPSGWASSSSCARVTRSTLDEQPRSQWEGGEERMIAMAQNKVQSAELGPSAVNRSISSLRSVARRRATSGERRAARRRGGEAASGER